jgi:acetylornithine deacetylase/succinyl-diaminopimelate desuccinylase-like protein
LKKVWQKIMLAFTSQTIAPLHYSNQGEQRSRWLSQLGELIAFPTISALPQHRRDLKACTQWLARHLAEIGLQNVRVLPGVNKGAPSVYADWLLAPGKPTLLLYSHYTIFIQDVMEVRY